MKVIYGYPRIIIHLMDSQFDKFEEYHKLNFLKLTNKPIVLVSISWYKKNDSVPQFLPYQNNYEIVILANTQEEKYYYENTYFIESIFINQNCFTNEEEFYIEETDKKYELFVNSAFDSYKKLHLTKLVNNIIYVGRFIDEKTLLSLGLNYDGYFPNFKNNVLKKENYTWLSGDTIRRFTNESHVAGIFSTTEGACFSSGQYLLCGIPVITPKCKGGREIWYNEDNVIYCDTTPESILKSLEIAKEKLKNGSFDKFLIRKQHIEMQEKFRCDLVHFIINKFKNDDEHFETNFEKLKKQLSVYQW